MGAKSKTLGAKGDKVATLLRTERLNAVEGYGKDDTPLLQLAVLLSYRQFV